MCLVLVDARSFGVGTTAAGFAIGTTLTWSGDNMALNVEVLETAIGCAGGG
jgi:hypothetical protein